MDLSPPLETPPAANQQDLLARALDLASTLARALEGLLAVAPPPGVFAPPAGAGSAGPRGLLLALLAETDQPLKAASIARRLGRANSGSFREILRALVDEGKVLRLDGRYYWAADRPLPAAFPAGVLLPAPDREPAVSREELAGRIAAARAAKAAACGGEIAEEESNGCRGLPR